MADYNVQMKQYNGTSFDNILPYASQALTLAGGGGATEIIAQARAGLSQIATGSYVGTGTYGQSNPTVINCGFKPKMMLVFKEYGLTYDGRHLTKLYATAEDNGNSEFFYYEGLSKIYIDGDGTYIFFITELSNGISYYCQDQWKQLNQQFYRYYWFAFA